MPHTAPPADEVALLATLLETDLGPAADLLDRHGSLSRLARLGGDLLAAEPSVGPVRARRLCAAWEVGRRALRPVVDTTVVEDAESAYALLGPSLHGLDVEELHGLYLDRRRRPLALRTLTRGSDRFTVVDPRQIFRPAVALGAAGVVIAHNHPSGDPSPSAQDIEVTRRVAAAGGVVGVELVDHLVVGGGGWTSLRSHGAFAGRSPIAACWTA